MTYLELVNSVLIKLRESQVGSVSETTYSSLVGSFINDAKRVVEDAWQWGSLRNTASFAITTGNQSYSFNNDLFERARVYLSTVTNKPLIRITTPTTYFGTLLIPVDFTYQYDSRDGNTSQTPSKYYVTSNNTQATSGQSRLTINFISPMDVNYTFKMEFVNPQNALTTSTDILSVPSDPVIQLAYLYCLYERGEELGEMLSMTERKAQQSLTDAISLDQASSISELQFQVV